MQPLSIFIRRQMMISNKFFDSDTSIQSEIVNLITAQKLIPVIGSGFTRNCPARSGFVPSGGDMVQHMIKVLANKYGKDEKHYKDYKFSELCTMFDKRTTTSEKFDYFSQNFTGVILDKDKKDFINLGWPYLYSLNIDDAIEKNSEFSVILPRKEFYYKYIEEFKTVFKIHGDVDFYLKDLDNEEIIFNKKQYIDSLKSNKKMLAKFQDDFGTNNLMYIGCSLNDEPDLLSVISTSIKNNPIHRGTYYVSDKKLDLEMQDLLEDYGITTCVVVSDYNLFYRKISKLVNDTPVKSDTFIDFYSEPEINILEDDKSDLNYLLKSDNLIPVPYKRKIFKPHFFINRTVSKKILEDLKYKSPIHIIYGHRISGKTYCLFGIYESIKDKKRYFFPSNTQITDSALNTLMNKKNCALFFDSQALTARQMIKVVNYKNTLMSNSSYVIFCVNTSDRYAVNLLTDEVNFKVTPTKNIFNIDEEREINSVFESSNMPRFGFVENKFNVVKGHKVRVFRTLLDNIFVNAEKFGRTHHGYAYPSLSDISGFHDLVIIILLATQQSISSYDMRYFDIYKECADFSNRFPTLTEWIYIDTNLTRLDSKYRLNSNTRYYLLKFLGDYSADSNNHPEIIDAYKYIYNKISLAEGDSFHTTRKMLDYVKFDVINDIFYRKNNSGVNLIKNIYESLEDEMNTEPQFKHQRAKSILWLYEDNVDELYRAADYINLSHHNTEVLYKSNGNKLLNISLGHIEYTRSLIYGRICSLENYANEENIKISLGYYSEALLNPVNSKELESLREEDTDKRIRNDLEKLLMFIADGNGLDDGMIQQALTFRDTLDCF